VGWERKFVESSDGFAESPYISVSHCEAVL
jgi:hypothetical protein